MSTKILSDTLDTLANKVLAALTCAVSITQILNVVLRVKLYMKAILCRLCRWLAFCRGQGAGPDFGCLVAINSQHSSSGSIGGGT